MSRSLLLVARKLNYAEGVKAISRRSSGATTVGINKSFSASMPKRVAARPILIFCECLRGREDIGHRFTVGALRDLRIIALYPYRDNEYF